MRKLIAAIGAALVAVAAFAAPAHADNACVDTRACNEMPGDPEPTDPEGGGTTPAPEPETPPTTVPTEPPPAPGTDSALPPAAPGRDVPGEGGGGDATTTPGSVGTDTGAWTSVPATPGTPLPPAAPADGTSATASLRPALSGSLAKTGVAGLFVLVSAIVGAFSLRRRPTISEAAVSAPPSESEEIAEPVEVPAPVLAVSEHDEDGDWVAEIEAYLAEASKHRN